MKKLRRVFHLGLWGPRVEDGVDWEIEHHINERIDQLVAAGLSRSEAESEARRAFGDVARVRRELRVIDRETERRMKLGQWLETVLLDVRYGLRGLRRNPGFALALTLTLGLGIGANVSMFTVLDALMLRPLAYPAPKELRTVWTTDNGERDRPYFSHAVGRRMLQEQTIGEMFGYTSYEALYLGGAEPVTLSVRAVTHGFEETLRVHPFLGRGFEANDERVGAEPVVLVDYNFWNGALGADRSVVNRQIELSSKRYTVIGVMPKGFKFPTYATSEIWVPVLEDGSVMGTPMRSMLELVTRVREEQLPRAQAQAGALTQRLFRESAPETEGIGALLEPLDRNRRDKEMVNAVALLSGAVLLILLIAGVNMVNLLLVRASARAREIAVRLAIGASRSRVMRQLLTEAMTLALLSGVASVMIALFVLRGIATIMPSRITFFAPFPIELESRALLFTFVLTVVCGTIFGLMPAFLATRRGRRETNADLTRYATRTVSRTRLRRGLVVVEVALSVMLLVGAGLLMRSFVTLIRIDPGFEPQNLAIMRIQQSSANQPDSAARGAFFRAIEQRLEAIPGVHGVTLAGGMAPRASITFTDTLYIDGKAPLVGNVVLPHTEVRPDFMDVVGAKLVLGRGFKEGDSPDQVIVDEDLARAISGDQSPIGMRFRPDERWEWQTVIGVMKDFKMLGPADRFGDYAMLTAAGRHENLGGYMAIMIRTNGNPRPFLPAIRQAMLEVDRRQPIADLQPATSAYVESIDMPRFLVVLIGILAVVALALASVGVYGVLAFGVSQRQHEIGVRMALGARAADLNTMVIREGLLLAVAGTIIGVSGALALSRFIRGVLFSVQPTDPMTFAAVAAALIGAALLASAIPARRATRVNPIMALKAE